MDHSEICVVNVGEVARDGLRLKTMEAVALVHGVCEELHAGSAVALPSSPDNLAVTDVGTVKILPTAGEPQPVRMAVATLLDRLFEDVTDEPGHALRTLPSRLRAVGDQDKKSDVKDLLSILRWHLPKGSREVLQDLFARAKRSDTGKDEEAGAVFAAEQPEDDASDLRLPAPLVAAPPIAPMKPARRRRSGPAWAYAAAALLAFGISGYSGYRFTALSNKSDEPYEPAGIADIAQAPTAAPPASAPRVIARPERRSPRPVNLQVSGGAFSPSFTTEPRTLLFHAGRNSSGRLFRATLDERGNGAAITPLFDETARNYHARPSPDGQWIAFDSDREGERAVFIARRDGKVISRVSGDGYAAVPSWSPDMRTLAFVRAEPARRTVWNLWMRDLATGQLSRATEFQAGQVWGATWFSDSASYAYSHENRLIIADRSGTEVAAFESPLAGRLIRTPAVSPDGREIVFQVYRDGAWILDVNTGEMRRILEDPTAEEFTWSPDGAQLAYHSRRDGEWRIWVMTP